ncbi:hypothetical protein CVT25_003187 [Psilocybe cyanescens]|uniref:H-type lectin domain-containing protein n=1 Tax=Psilocybe cyanescens TaxID=93625 RepID=A0A409XF08_PSICY|nr:hypothetical protein CVT25_003187 [Psilocybe cyanescens]
MHIAPDPPQDGFRGSTHNMVQLMVRGGTDSDGQELYIGRGRYKVRRPPLVIFGANFGIYHQNGMHPGTYRHDGNGTLTISWGGDSITLNNFELLFASPSSLQWIRLEERFLLNKTDGFEPITGGYESDNRPLYVIQGFHQDGVYCGKIREKSIGYLPYNGDEVMINKYNVLVGYKAPHTLKGGRFKTMNEVGTYKTLKPGNTYSRSIPILTSSSTPPRVAVWLDNIDISNTNSCWRIQSYVDNISQGDFCAHLDTWSTSLLYNAGLSWMQIESTDPNFLCGVVHHKGETTQRVSFDWCYEQPPLVFIALCSFDLGKCPRISIKADNIDCSGFELKAKKWQDTIIYGFHMTWIAFPANSEVIQYGAFTADTKAIGSATFSPAFERPPTVLAGFTKFDLHKDNIRLNVDVENVSHIGMDWKISTWAGSKINSVDVNYIAFV